MQGVHEALPEVHEGEQAAVDRLPPPLERVPRMSHGQVRTHLINLAFFGLPADTRYLFAEASWNGQSGTPWDSKSRRRAPERNRLRRPNISDHRPEQLERCPP